jgi:hypothetical protein
VLSYCLKHSPPFCVHVKKDFDMTPENAMLYAREDIAELGRAPTYGDCVILHAAIIGYCRALVDCGLISAAQQKVLLSRPAWKWPAGMNKRNRLCSSLTDIFYGGLKAP